MYLEAKALKQLIPYTTVFVIVNGYIKHHIYYSEFNVRIIDFIELEEILTLFMPDILWYLLIVGISAFVPFFLDTRARSESMENRKSEIGQIDGIRKRLSAYLKFYRLVAIPFYIWTPVIIVSKLFFPDRYGIIFFLLAPQILILPFLILLDEFRRKYQMFYGSFNATYTNLIMISFMILYFAFVGAHSDINSIKLGNSFRYTSFTIGNTSYYSTKTKYVIGLTRHYLFYYDSSLDITETYKRSEINRLETHTSQH